MLKKPPIRAYIPVRLELAILSLNPEFGNVAARPASALR
jgi:hypothetical protein